MSSPATYARIFRRPVLRADEKRTVVTAAGRLWSITGEFTTPAIGRTPAFIATSIRFVNDDGSEGDEMIDHLAPVFIANLQEQAVESLLEGRYAA